MDNLKEKTLKFLTYAFISLDFSNDIIIVIRKVSSVDSYMKYYILEGYLTYFRFSVFLRQTDDQTYSLRVTGLSVTVYEFSSFRKRKSFGRTIIFFEIPKYYPM